MKTAFIGRAIAFLLFSQSIYSYGQSPYFDQYKQDTIHLESISFKKIVALQTVDAVIGIDYKLFLDNLAAERKGCKKQIKERERLLKKGKTIDEILVAQTNMYKKQLAGLDSVYKLIGVSNRDTVFVNYAIIYNAGSPFGDFLPKLLEGSKCLLFNKQMQRQHFIIRQKGWKKTGAMTSQGSTLYFLPGSNHHFWSRSDFST
jgi:hypothetical protein